VSDDRSYRESNAYRYNRAEASRYGVDVNSLGNVIKLVTTGITLSISYRMAPTTKLILCCATPVNQRSLDQLDQLQIPTNQGSILASNLLSAMQPPKQGIINRKQTERKPLKLMLMSKMVSGRRSYQGH